MNNRWQIKSLSNEQRTAAERLAAELNISIISASMLVRRGLLSAQDARNFVSPQLDMLHDPFLMTDMDKAVARLDKAVQFDEHILVFGDYDVDGTTAVALMYTFLSSVVHSPELVDYYIPDRYTEGYGISRKGIDYAVETGCSLIVALDCGIRSTEEVNYAADKGIDFIICDHHLPGQDIPKAVAVLDAKRSDSTYPFSELCGCGVGFKLAQAYSAANSLPFDNLRPCLALTAMAIASDIVPVVGENRVLAYYGIRMLNSAPPVGIKNLMNIAGIESGKLNINDLVYKIGPRINACGRIRSGRDAVRLLITDNNDEAKQMSEEINHQNEIRRDLDQQITNEALQMLMSDPCNQQKHTTVVCGNDWHKGVVGIVASRLIDNYYRPTIVLTLTDGMVSGSARSVGGFDIYSAIDSCSDLLENFGGHIFAAGLSMKPENLEAFKQRFEDYVGKHILPEQTQPVLEIEAEISFADITARFFNILRHLEPFGPGNPRPLFLTRNVTNYRYTRRVGKQGEHLKLDVTDRTGALQGIAFGKGEYALPLMNGENIDICYELQQNTFNGQTTIQMMVHDIKAGNNKK
ncbi:MAG: single-stranded-DNA-specific exonuclease RecJ [Paludibacteraceae bacterium]|nr:single-stranded-DNA-specific exonuclease RecJ [Paludibacteraceae bacterium]